MRNYELRLKSSNARLPELGYFPNRGLARALRTPDMKISRGPDHPHVKASPDKGMHPKKSKAKTRAFI